jgi:hypothetical protein
VHHVGFTILIYCGARSTEQYDSLTVSVLVTSVTDSNWATDWQWCNCRCQQQTPSASGAHTPSIERVLGENFLEVNRPRLKLTTYLHPVSKLRMTGTIPQFPPYAFTAYTPTSSTCMDWASDTPIATERPLCYATEWCVVLDRVQIGIPGWRGTWRSVYFFSSPGTFSVRRMPWFIQFSRHTHSLHYVQIFSVLQAHLVLGGCLGLISSPGIHIPYTTSRSVQFSRHIHYCYYPQLSAPNSPLSHHTTAHSPADSPLLAAGTSSLTSQTLSPFPSTTKPNVTASDTCYIWLRHASSTAAVTYIDNIDTGVNSDARWSPLNPLKLHSFRRNNCRCLQNKILCTDRLTGGGS